MFSDMDFHWDLMKKTHILSLAFRASWKSKTRALHRKLCYQAKEKDLDSSFSENILWINSYLNMKKKILINILTDNNIEKHVGQKLREKSFVEVFDNLLKHLRMFHTI